MTVRFGVVGTGFWARTVHAAGVAAHPGTELVGVWGRDPGKARDLAAELDATAYQDFDELVSAVDALTFAVPPQVQSSLALRAAESGRHLLLEKPVTTDLDEAERLVAAAADVSTVVFFTGRFVPSWEDWLTRAVSRAPVGGRAEWLTSTGPDSPFGHSSWRRERGALWDVGPHALSFLLPALGPVAAVSGGRGPGDLVNLVLTHESGASSVMTLSMTMPGSTHRVVVEVYGEGGFDVRPEDPRDADVAYARALSELVGCIAAGSTTHRCDVRFGRDVVAVLTRCEAALTGLR
ncbi:MAG TPA: Gfo/Idh/MocA family oxidoreductase [Nocardioides sp.]|nr:Gfo/Idh/MocA family oxidoreductase [Nocardioides sp.]